MSVISKDLIFDIGLHKGLDANFYLRKGFRVVGLEAVPELCTEAAELNAEYVRLRKLTIVNKALYYRAGETVDFYINPDKDDWGSLFKGAAEKGVGQAKKISSATITLEDLINEFGSPYYIKCDIEGGDAILCRQLLSLEVVPSFISAEATSVEDIAFLRSAGYDRFQIINQYFHPWTRPLKPPLEGGFADVNFSHEMSGLFGQELDRERWVSFADALRDFQDWHDLSRRNRSLMVGWLDVHAAATQTLDL